MIVLRLHPGGWSSLQYPADGSAPLDIELEVALGDCERVEFQVAGEALVADRSTGRLRIGDIAAPLDLDQDRLALRILVDRGSIEVFAQEGRVAISHGRPIGRDAVAITAAATGGQAVLKRAAVHAVDADRE